MILRRLLLTGFCLLICVIGLKAQTCQTTALYELVFESDWTATTHPDDFPANPHFSGLIGATHNASAILWEPGQLASTGVKDVAERGSKSALQSEIAAFDAAGHVGQVVSAGGLGAPPTSRTITFTATCDHPELSLISMLAPSPDWFVGVHGLSLLDSGAWIEDYEEVLFVYDSGTDDGVSYSDPNAVTDPPEPISQIQGFPFLVAGEVVPVAKYKIRLLELTARPSSRIFLQGPYANGAMETTLNANLPLSQPFGPAPWGYGGIESVATMPADVVEWVLLELRDSATDAVVARRAGLLSASGDFMDVDGGVGALFTGLAPDAYRMVVHQRNHLAMRSAGVVQIR